jgi:hypothetical protein
METDTQQGAATMLSFLYSLVREFRAEHGYAPNLVYLSAAHYSRLSSEVPQFRSHDQITQFLQMEIVISNDALHPHVAWIRPRHLRYAAAS